MTGMIRVRLFLRSFLVQGSWNDRNLIGTGLAWALLPTGRGKEGKGKPKESPEGQRVEAFNAHPYLSPVALGALAKIEGEGIDPERVSRFKAALRSALGSLGDRLIWTAWRPFCLMGGLLGILLGGAPGLVVGGLLVAYNSVHLALRGWGLSVGLRRGLEVAGALRRATLAEWAERIAVGGVLVSGVLCGALAGGAFQLGGSGLLWIGLSVVALVVGFRWVAPRRFASMMLMTLVLLGFLVSSGPPPSG